MSDQLLNVVVETAAGLVGKAYQASSEKTPSAATPAAPAVESGSGEKGLKRLPVGNKQAEQAQQDPTAVDSSTETTTETVQAYTTLMDLMYSLLSTVNANLCISQNQMAEISNLEALQGQAATKIAEQNQIDVNNQIAEQEKKQKRMKWIGWAVKGLVIGIAAASVVATGGLSAAPVTALLMLSLTTLTVVKPDLLTNGINKLAGVLSNNGVMPEKIAKILVTVLVLSVIITATAGAGAADGALVAKAGVSYGTIAAGSALTSSGELIGTVNPFVKLMNAFAENPPLWLAATVNVASVLTALTLGVGGGLTLASSGAISAEESTLRTGARIATTSLNVAKGGAQMAEGGETIAYGAGQEKLADLEARQTLYNAALKNTSSFTQSTRALMQLITQSMKHLAQGTHSLAVPAMAVTSSAA